MTVAYLANVGTRDIQIIGETLRLPRQDGERFLALYSNEKVRFRAPILLPGLRHVLGVGGQIDLVQLFASDQPSPTPEKYRQNDTIHIGRILERFVKDQLGDRVGVVRCHPYPHNPSSHDVAVKYFAAELPLLVPPDAYDEVWVAPIGGADATNMGLTLNAVRLYRRHCQFIYVSPPQQESEEGQVQALSLHREFLGDYAREEARAYLSRRDFPALRRALEAGRLAEPWQLALCDYADSRLRFDFEAAAAALDAALEAAEGADTRARVRRYRESVGVLLAAEKGLTQPDSGSDPDAWKEWFTLQRARLRELYFNLRLKAERGEWVDFLGRLFRLHEAALRLCFETATVHSTEKHDGGFRDFEGAILADRDTLDFFREKGVDWKQPDTHVLRMWLEVRVRKDGGRFGPIRGCMNTIQGLSELRNKSILAHGYRGVAREHIESTLKGESVMDFVDRDLRGLLSALEVEAAPEDDPVAAVVASLEV